MQLGTCTDGRALTYDARLYEFRLARELVTYADVRDLDDHAHIHWRAPEQRDWFRRINPRDLKACNDRALSRLGGDYYAGMSPEERVQADAARDDSVLAGKIVDADPALVQAVAAQLEEQGLLGGAAVPAGGFNPLASVNLPKGMEALSQMERHHGADRKMTAAEKRLMKKILKNDDKEKARREKQAARAGASPDADAASTPDGEKGSSPQARITSDAINVVAANPEHHRFPEITYTDSAGNPIRPAADAVRPDMEQYAQAMSEEERALNEMRERNRKAEYDLAATDVPGMERKGRARHAGATNPDGSPKRGGLGGLFSGGGGKSG